jgi:hypothetical protein
MSPEGRHNLKAIRFGSELLPNWAQLLDLASRLCPVSEDVRHWFTLLTSRSGVDDSRTVTERCGQLRRSLLDHRGSVEIELGRYRDDAQACLIISAWLYGLETMIQESEASKTCSWTVEGTSDDVTDESDGGDITLRRV